MIIVRWNDTQFRSTVITTGVIPAVCEDSSNTSNLIFDCHIQQPISHALYLLQLVACKLTLHNPPLELFKDNLIRLLRNTEFN